MYDEIDAAFAAGAVHNTCTCSLLVMAVTMSGASGAPTMTVLETSMDDASPSLFSAEMAKS